MNVRKVSLEEAINALLLHTIVQPSPAALLKLQFLLAVSTLYGLFPFSITLLIIKHGTNELSPPTY
jgi:hypothetical protein